jgi:dienelactone hydrolase
MISTRFTMNQMLLSFLAVLWPMLTAVGVSAQSVELSPGRRQALLEETLRVLPRSQPWEHWLKATRTLPPDIDALPALPHLPDPLRFANGDTVTKEDWPRRKQELLSLFQHYVIGTLPPTPTNVFPMDIRSREEAGALIDGVLLSFGPRSAATLRMELIYPRGGRPPFPVFLTQDNHRSWALVAVSRGYIGCIYAGADSRDDTSGWTNVWPQADWTKLTRRAWAASRCVDYLHRLPIVDTNKIALAGHSRNGKTSLIAAAIDQRINAVISSSSGAGGACSWRLFSEAQFGEGIELITRTFPDWIHPRLRFFAGREHKLPIDQNQLIACLAPRPCLISSAVNDNVESLWAIEHTFYSARRAYALLEKTNQLYLRYRAGGHETRAEDIETYLDWLDSVFRRAPFAFPDCAVFPTYETWQAISQARIDPMSFPAGGLEDLLVGTNGLHLTTIRDWVQKRDSVRARILWGLGEAPPFAEGGLRDYGAEKPYRATLLGRGSVLPGLAKKSVNFGNYIAGDLYYPTNADTSGKKVPAVVWIHPISVSNGYVPGYRRGEAPHLAMARLGLAVMAFDQIGNGSRVDEIRNFYPRYPYWSLLGKQVEDTLAAVEVLRQTPWVDAQRIFLLGYGTGGMVALHAAALDERIVGVISVAGFTPMRLDTADKGTGGLARYSHWLPLQPRLGAFIGHENRIPYDYHELLALIAPRSAVVFAPRLDTQATLADVKKCVSEAGKVYDLLGARFNLKFHELDDYSRFSPETQQVVFEQLRALAGL